MPVKNKDTKVYVVRLKSRVWFLRFLEAYQYRVEEEFQALAHLNAGEWTAFHQYFDTEEEAHIQVVKLWASQSHPFLVYVCGKLFNSNLIQYRQEQADYYSISFWKRI